MPARDERQAQNAPGPRQERRDQGRESFGPREREDDDERSSERRGPGSREMLINVAQEEEARIAVIQNGVLDELYIERLGTNSHIGNIYKGKVTNVEPSIQACFVDFGIGKNGFLHISDLNTSYFPDHNGGAKERVGRKRPRRDRPPIQECLRRGQELIVQVTKEGIGTKGPTLTTYLSIPGRYLVLMPGMNRLGVSRKVEDEDIRSKARDLMSQLSPPKDLGFIIRTAGIDRKKTDLQRDMNFLIRLWRTIEKKINTLPAPAELYQESDLITRTIRDIYGNNIDRIICDSEDTVKNIRDFMSMAMPRTRAKVLLHAEPVALFEKYRIEEEIEKIQSRVYPLRSGGSLVIDSTEAIVAIDVNSGKYRVHEDAEMTAFKINMQAAPEVARQLRLRDLGGVIIVDFIDMVQERHRRDVEKTLRDAMAPDRAKTKILRISQFGIVEMTRQRMRPSFTISSYMECPHCKGFGRIKTPESMSIEIVRRLQHLIGREPVASLEVNVSADVAHFLLNRKRGLLVDLEKAKNKAVVICANSGYPNNDFNFIARDIRGSVVSCE